MSKTFDVDAPEDDFDDDYSFIESFDSMSTVTSSTRTSTTASTVSTIKPAKKNKYNKEKSKHQVQNMLIFSMSIVNSSHDARARTHTGNTLAHTLTRTHRPRNAHTCTSFFYFQILYQYVVLAYVYF